MGAAKLPRATKSMHSRINMPVSSDWRPRRRAASSLECPAHAITWDRFEADTMQIFMRQKVLRPLFSGLVATLCLLEAPRYFA